MLNLKIEEPNDEIIVDGNIDYNEELFKITYQRYDSYEEFCDHLLLCCQDDALLNFRKDGGTILMHLASNITDIPKSRSVNLDAVKTLNHLFYLARFKHEYNIDYFNDEYRSEIDAIKRRVIEFIGYGNCITIDYKEEFIIIAISECLFDALQSDDDVYLKKLLKIGSLFTNAHKLFAKEKCKKVLIAQDELNQTLITVPSVNQAKLAISKGAQINGIIEGRTVLYELLFNKRTSLTKFILQCEGINPYLGDDEDSSVLTEAVMISSLQIVTLLLDAGVNPNWEVYRGDTSIHILSYSKENRFIASKLIESGVDVNAQNEFGDTALHLAIINGNEKIINTLLNSEKININLQNKRGYTPLHSAIETGNIEVIKHLLERNAKLDICNCDGDTPFHLAIKKSKQPIINIFLKNIAAINLNARNNNGDTVLHTAIRESNNLAVQKLLECNLDLNTTNDEGQTPLMLAQSMNLFAITEIIRRSATAHDLLNPVLSR